MPSRSWRTVAACLLLASLLVPLAQSGPPVAAQQADPALEVVPGSYIVVLKDEPSAISASSIRSLDAVPGVEVDQRYTSVFNGFSAEIDPSAAEELADDPSVAAIFPDLVQYAFGQSIPTGVDRIDADRHPTRAGDGGGAAIDIDIAIVDTGVSRNSDLNLAGGVNCTGNGSSYDDDNFHGTFVAGLAAAKDNGIGIVGAAPGARVWGVKVLDFSGQGRTSWILCGLDWVAQRSGTIEVANLSLGAHYPFPSTCAEDSYHAAFCELAARGVTVVAAAGNGNLLPDGTTVPWDAGDFVPAAYPEVLTVSALDDRDGTPRGDTFADFSNFGPVVDIAAPGVNVRSLDFQGGTMEGSGTSFSAPLVAGGAALVLRDSPGSSPASVKRRLLEAAQHGKIPGDPDGYAEPVMSVGFLGPGSVTSIAGAKPGEVAPVKIANFAAGSKVYVKFDGKVLGSVLAGANGTGTFAMTVPITARGPHVIEATNVRKKDTTSFSVRPRISLSTRSGPVDGSVDVTLRGFAVGESILLTFDTGAATRSLVRVTASSSGSAGAKLVVPSSTAGAHRVAAVGSRGNDTSTTFTTTPSVRARPGASNVVDVELRGFRGGETVAIKWDDPARTVATTTTLTTGSKSLKVTVPPGSKVGNHTVRADGTSNDAATTMSLRSMADVRTPTRTATATSTTAPTREPSATEPPIPAATDVATLVPTEAPTEAPTEIPTEVPTETPIPTEVPPTETATEVPPTEIPTEVPPTEVPPTETLDAAEAPLP